MNRLVRMVLLSVAVILAFVAGSDAWGAERTAKLTPVRIAVVSRVIERGHGYES